MRTRDTGGPKPLSLSGYSFLPQNESVAVAPNSYAATAVLLLAIERFVC